MTVFEAGTKSSVLQQLQDCALRPQGISKSTQLPLVHKEEKVKFQHADNSVSHHNTSGIIGWGFFCFVFVLNPVFKEMAQITLRRAVHKTQSEAVVTFRRNSKTTTQKKALRWKECSCSSLLTLLTATTPLKATESPPTLLHSNYKHLWFQKLSRTRNKAQTKRAHLPLHNWRLAFETRI